jgi:hypothetical protein
MHRAKKHKSKIVIALVGGSFLWTVLSWPQLKLLQDKLTSVYVIALLLAITEACFVIGAFLMAATVGLDLTGSKTGAPKRGRVTQAWKARGLTRQLADIASTDRKFLFGFNLNWLGAMGTGIILAAGIVWVLPYTAWGLLILPFLDIIATNAWRVPVSLKLKEMRLK